jgi:predicted nucleic acid-binding OB-fold protein
LTNNCSTVTPGQTLNPWQKLGLELDALLHSGRDVILAIDLTDSVGLNDEGRIRIEQIIKDTLQSDDRVYIVPFANKVNPLSAKLDSLSSLFAVEYQGKSEGRW